MGAGETVTQINSLVKKVLKNVTITDILEAINKKYGNRPALRINMEDGSSRQITFVKLGRKVIGVSSALINLGIEKNDRVAILSENRPEWAIAFFGIISCAATVVPIDIKLSDKEIRFILDDTQTKCVFVSKKYIGVIDNLRSDLPHIERVILLDENGREDVISLKGLKKHRGKERGRPISTEDTALIVYTSGTTGIAKGVEISCKNLLFQVMTFSKMIHCGTRDRFLSILPLNHMLEMTGGLIVPLYGGSCVTYCDSLKPTTLLPLMRKCRTTAMICVPLVLKMLHGGIMKKADKLSPSRQKVFKTFLSISRFLLKFEIRIGKLLFRPVHEEFGGRLRGFVSGGAPLDVDIEVDLNAMGFRVLQGYGLTETAPVISVNTYRMTKFGSVGRPLPGVDVRIIKESNAALEGEILTRGPHVMKGYFRNLEETRAVMKDGWFSTGDLGYFDKNGFLHISGRLKNLIALGTGKKVFPEEVEAVIGKSPYIKEMSVLGRIATRGLREGHEEVFAVIVPEHELFEESERTDKQKMRDRISSEIARLSKSLAVHKRIMDFDIWEEELPKTVTRKIKRKVLVDMINEKRGTDTIFV